MPRGKVENLKSLKTRTTAEQRKIARQGGKASGKARREKKLMSQIYADILADQSGIKKGKGLRAVIEEIMNDDDPRGKSAKVSLIKELREGTEGNKSTVETTLNVNTTDPKIADILARHGISKSEN